MNNLYNPKSRSKQTNNFLPSYSENPNAFTDSEVASSQAAGLNLATENPIGAGIINALVNGVIGDGLKLESFIDKTLLRGVTDEQVSKIQETIETYWKLWSSNPSMCDHYGQNSLAGIEALALKSVASEGDGLLHIKIVKNDGFYYPQIQWIDGIYVATPTYEFGKINIVAGVELDSQGREVAYHVKQSKGNDLNITYKRCPVKSRFRDLKEFTLVKGNEIQQGLARGRSLLIPVKELLIQSNRFIEAEITKAVVQSLFTLFITKEKDETYDPDKSNLNDIKGAASEVMGDDLAIQEADERDRQITMGDGAINELLPGEKIETPETKAPTAAFNEFINTALRLIGMGVNIPYEVLKKEFNSNYSASQAALQEAARSWDNYRADFVTKFIQPIYIAFVDCLVLQGIISCPDYETNVFARASWRGSIWHGPHMLNIDPVKNIKAANMAINMNITSKEEAARQLYGNDYTSIVNRRSKEDAIEKTLFGEPIKVKDNGEKDEEEEETKDENEQ